jgi:hypothetical protein
MIVERCDVNLMTSQVTSEFPLVEVEHLDGPVHGSGDDTLFFCIEAQALDRRLVISQCPNIRSVSNSPYINIEIFTSSRDYLQSITVIRKHDQQKQKGNDDDLLFAG